MAGSGPNILVIADGGHDRGLIMSTLRGAGFAAVPATDRAAAAALRCQRFAAAVVALAEAEAPGLVAELRLLQPGLPMVMIVDPAASRALDECAVLVKRPLDPRQLLGCVVELVLRTDDLAAPAPRHGTTAELGIAAARLACLHNRHSAAAATGAARLAQDLKRQIGEVRSTCRGLAAASIGLAIEGCAG